jgi:DinB family protein
MEASLQDTVALLTKTPGALDALLRDLPEGWTMRNEGEDTWDVRYVIGHLIHCERINWMPRTRWILQFGESKPFEPFDRRSDQNEPLPQLLDEFARMRSQSLNELRALDLQPEDMKRSGLHPQLGAMVLSDLLATWAVHDLTHLHQISRIMAHQYREAVGPWITYLGVLQCNGHSA